MPTLLEKFYSSRERSITAPSGIIYLVRPVLHESFNQIYEVLRKEKIAKDENAVPTAAQLRERIEYQRLVAQAGTVKMTFEGEETDEIPPAGKWPIGDVAVVYNAIEEISSPAKETEDETRRVL